MSLFERTGHEQRAPSLTTAALFCALSVLLVSGCAASLTNEDSYILTRGNETSVSAAMAFEQGRYRSALDKFTEALRLHRSVDDGSSVLLDLINIGRVNLALERSEEAEAVLNDAISLAESLDDRPGLSEAHATMAKAVFMAGSYTEALEHLDRSERIDTALGRVSGAKLNLKALIYIEAGRTGEAAEILKRALRLNKKSNDYPETANSYRARARLALVDGHLDSAERSYDAAYEIDKRLGRPAKIAHDLVMKGRVLKKKGKPGEAAVLFERAYAVSLNHGMTAEAVGRIIERLIDAYTETGDDERVQFYTSVKERFLERGRTKGDLVE